MYLTFRINLSKQVQRRFWSHIWRETGLMRRSEAPGPRQASDSLLYLSTTRGFRERNHRECGRTVWHKLTVTQKQHFCFPLYASWCHTVNRIFYSAFDIFLSQDICFPNRNWFKNQHTSPLLPTCWNTWRSTLSRKDIPTIYTNTRADTQNLCIAQTVL